ncbi:MAG: serine phosphatase RsbU (regulator of sigma subunit) [Arenicella sp.]|jgi:serine phosphatase RsbU (regulator of sigma subunit)
MKTLASEKDIEKVDLTLQRFETLQTKANELEESIRYAGSLQKSILPPTNHFNEIFDDAFVLYQPKDIVGGDFYWLAQFEREVYFAVGDCTGHGVPGAMVNIAGNTILRQLIRKQGLSDPAAIIEELDSELIGLFNENKSEGQTYDGMDIVFCKFNLDDMIGSYCGAGRPLVMVRDGEIIEHKKGLSSVGYHLFGEKSFETVEFELKKGDLFYLFSDGYTDQFGGDNIKKFNRRRFRNLLTSIADMDLAKQKKELNLTLQNWMGNQEQIDDVCVLGIKI